MKCSDFFTGMAIGAAVGMTAAMMMPKKKKCLGKMGKVMKAAEDIADIISDAIGG